MLVTDFDFELPEELIAQRPPKDRGDSRMLTLNRKTGAWRDTYFRELPQHLVAGDLLVLNNSRVIPARLFAQRESGRAGRIEVLLTEQRSETEWQALVRPGRKVPVAEQLLFFSNDTAKPSLRAQVIARGEYGERTLRFEWRENFFEILDRIGHIPLPPYIHRETSEDSADDRDRYQTVYARDRGSVAAPTAGLHFTSEVLDDLSARGVRLAFVTLHVGLGTFAPLRVDRVDEVRLHSERYSLPEDTAAELNAARSEGRRIIAAGTTTVRTLEHCAHNSGDKPLTAHSGSTNIFISPGFEFRIVNAMLTNFHLPQSSLLMLVSAFAGRENVLAAYRHAVEAKYRFFSYGDCMWIA